VLLPYKAASPDVSPDAYVFSTSKGGRQSIDNIRSRVFDKAVQRADEQLAEVEQPPLPEGLTPHKLRHTFASLLAALGKTRVM
jgi:integrase